MATTDSESNKLSSAEWEGKIKRNANGILLLTMCLAAVAKRARRVKVRVESARDLPETSQLAEGLELITGQDGKARLW